MCQKYYQNTNGDTTSNQVRVISLPHGGTRMQSLVLTQKNLYRNSGMKGLLKQVSVLKYSS